MVNDEQWELIRPVVARLRASIVAISFGLATGTALFAATAWLVARGGENVGAHLGLLRNYFPGYSVTLGGAFLGFFYGTLTGGVLGFAAAWIYNAVALKRDPGGA